MLRILTSKKVVVCLVLIILLLGCQKPVVLHPISTLDIQRLEKGDKFVAPKDGYFLSDEYLEEVAKVRVEEKR